MALEVTGRLHVKGETQQIKENFSKRDFVLELTDESPTGMTFTNYAQFQLTNAQCAIIDNFHSGQLVKVSFNIRGNKWERDGQVKYITNLAAWRIENVGSEQHYSKPDPQQQQAQPPQSNQSDDDLPF